MKLSSLSLIGITFASSNFQVVYGDTASCLTSISKAQICLRTCVNEPPIGDVPSTINSLLFQCISNGENLGSCCFPDDTNSECATSLSESSTCLATTLTNIRDKSNAYIQCIRQPLACEMASICVASLTGGAGVVGSPNNFDVGSLTLQTMASNATTCNDMDTFLNNACDTVRGCCSPCSPKIADVVQAVTNDLLLPAYNRAATAFNCDSMTCPKPDTNATTGPVRDLEEGSTTIMTSTGDDSDNDYGVDLAAECNDILAQDIVVYNETYAVDNFFGCLTKKMGAIMSKADDQAVKENVQAVEEEESSSSSSFFFGMASLSTSVIASSIIIAFISY